MDDATALHEPAPTNPVETSRWILPVLAVLGAAAVLVSLAAGPSRTLAGVGTGLANAGLLVLALAPVAFMAVRGRQRAGRAAATVVLMVAVSWVALSLPRVGPFADLDWNWQGKTVDLAWIAVLLVVLHRWARREAGLTLAVPRRDRRVALTVIGAWFGGFTLLMAVGLLVSDQTQALDVERLLFDAAHPNLVEELLWRGVLLAVLDRVCGTPWRLFGAPVGWGLVLTSLGFGLGHGLFLGDAGLVVDLGAVLMTGVAGVAMGWIRARTGSVWYAYLGHCAPELGIHAGTAAASLVA